MVTHTNLQPEKMNNIDHKGLTVSTINQQLSPVLILLPNDGFYHPPPDTFYIPAALYVSSPGLLLLLV